MGHWTILRGKDAPGPRSSGRSARERGWSLVEMTVALFLLMGIALYGTKTMVSAWMLQNWSIAQSMTDAYAGIETAYARRCIFADIPTGGIRAIPHWGLYPAATTNPVTMGRTPSQPVTATVIRTYHRYTETVTGAVSYLLESYVVYQDGERKYCRVSKVYRSE